MTYCSSIFAPYQENNEESFATTVDEYDPEKPNSYLLYCENREKEEEEAQKVYLVKQQLVENEQHMIDERKKLEKGIKEGTIFENRQPAGRGRGAAMTLPAWMTDGTQQVENPLNKEL